MGAINAKRPAGLVDGKLLWRGHLEMARAVSRSTAMMHSSSHAAARGFPEGRFQESLDLSKTIEAAGGVGITTHTAAETEINAMVTD